MQQRSSNNSGAPFVLTRFVSTGGNAIRFAQAIALAVAICFTLGATDASSRVDTMSHKLMCTCGCAQLLGECDHVGCPNRDEEFADLTGLIQNGSNDAAVMASFSAKYGPTALAAPTTHGFDLVAWIAPVAVFLAAVLGTILVAKQWSISKTQTAAPNAPSSPELDTLREKIRRETSGDGGF
jgi:hypothetical protein